MAVVRKAPKQPAPAAVPAIEEEVQPGLQIVVRDDDYTPLDEDRETVRRLAFIGLTAEEIGYSVVDRRTNMAMSAEEIIRYFPAEMRDGPSKVLAAVGMKAIQIATTKDTPQAVALQQYILRTQGGQKWKDTQRVEHVNNEAAKAQSKEVLEQITNVLSAVAKAKSAQKTEPKTYEQIRQEIEDADYEIVKNG